MPPTLPDPLREWGGLALIKLERFDAAVAYYGAWLEDQPSNAAVRNKLAGLYAKTGALEAAEKTLREAPPP